MVEIPPEKKQSKKLEISIAVVLIAVVLIAVIFLTFYNNAPAQNTNNEPVLSTAYEAIEPKDAYNLMNKSENLLIVDISTCKCKWTANCINLSSIWDHNPKNFYNETRDILVCDYYGKETDYAPFCNGLVNHTYGKIFYLKGGTTAWKQLGFPTYKCK
jgi:rhodanese-related sulfurtransferase